MADAIDTYCEVHKNKTTTLMAKAVDNDASNLVQADLSTITYSIYLLDESDPDSWTVVSGHDGVSLTVSNVIYDTLQTDDRWKKDATGYNFAHIIDISSNQVFTIAGRYYLVEYTLTPNSGQIIGLRFKVFVN